MTGSIAVSQCGHTPNRPGHHGTVVASTVGTVAISCNGFTCLSFSSYYVFHNVWSINSIILRSQFLSTQFFPGRGNNLDKINSDFFFQNSV